MSVAVLGAGPSGLVAAKEALENGLTPTVFEKEKELGGVWHPKTGAVWDRMRTNISKFTTVFGDTPWAEDTSELFPNSSSVQKYLNDYVDKFELRNYIQFHTEVVSVESDKNSDDGSSGWKVTWKKIIHDKSYVESKTFSGVIVATGIFAKSNIPTNIPGMSTFPGKILHSKQYKNAKDFVGLKILTVGGSFSGAEIAADVSTQAKASFHCFRRRFWILRRYLPNGEDKNGSQIPIDLLFYNRKFYTNNTKTKTQEKDEQKFANNKKNTNLLSFCRDQQNFEELKITQDEFSRPINSVISDNYLTQAENGFLVPIHGAIKEIKGRKILFQDGRTLDDIDVIIFGTGFQIDNSFFPKRILEQLQYRPLDRLQPLILFQECVQPNLRNLFFVGMYKGPYFGIIEQQARLAARVLSGKVTLPSKEVMEQGLRKEEAIRDQQFNHDEFDRPQFPHPEYVLFADSLATLANSFPDLAKLQDPNHSLGDALKNSLKIPPPSTVVVLEHRKQEIASRFMSEPVTPAHYNFVHAPQQVINQMDLVQQVIKQFGNM